MIEDYIAECNETGNHRNFLIYVDRSNYFEAEQELKKGAKQLISFELNNIIVCIYC